MPGLTRKRATCIDQTFQIVGIVLQGGFKVGQSFVLLSLRAMHQCSQTIQS